MVALSKHGPRHDTVYSDEGGDEPDEDGSDGSDGGLSDDGDDDHSGGECDIGGEPAVAGGEPAVAGCKPAVPDHAGPAAAAEPLALVCMDAAEADLVHDHQHGLDALRAVLDQVRAVGQDALAATVSHAIVGQERKCWGTKRAGDFVARAMAENCTSAVADAAAARTIAAKADSEAKRTWRTVRHLATTHDDRFCSVCNSNIGDWERCGNCIVCRCLAHEDCGVYCFRCLAFICWRHRLRHPCRPFICHRH